MVYELWNYKQTHILNSATQLTNYQVKLTIYKGTGTSSDSTMYCNGHCNDNFSDLRFALLGLPQPYWIESYVSGVSAIVWVKIGTILNTTLEIYYGNAIATSESNATNTFILFDDFSGDLSKWTINSGSWSIVSGKLQTTSTGSGSITSGISLSRNEYITTTINVSQDNQYGTAINIPNPVKLFYAYNQLSYYAGSEIKAYPPLTANTDYKIEIWRNSSSIIIKINNTQYISTSDIGSTGVFSLDHDMYSGITIKFSNILIRNYSTDPTHSTWTNEESISHSELDLYISTTTGIVPLLVTSTISSTISLNNIIINHGDGHTESIPSLPTTINHTYDTYGTYNLFVSANSTSDNTLYTKQATITVNTPSITPSFTYTQINNKISLTDTSNGSPNEWFWQFGDENTSIDQHPTHIYNLPGTYEISLYSSNQQHYNEFPSTKTITVDTPIPDTNFTYTILDDLSIPSNIQFKNTTTYDTSLGEYPTSIVWNIDSTTLTDINEPLYIFNTTGNHNISLNIWNNYHQFSSHSITITTGTPPHANFKPAYMNIIGPSLPCTITFTNLTIPDDIITEYSWNYGDETPATSSNIHAFATHGNYTVSLTATNAFGTNTKTYTNAINIHYRILNLVDDVTCSENTETQIPIKSFIDGITIQDIRCKVGQFINDSCNCVQRQVPLEPGIDERGIQNIYNNFNELGHYIINLITEFGSKLIKMAKYDDKTGFVIFRTIELEDNVYAEEDLETNQ